MKLSPRAAVRGLFDALPVPAVTPHLPLDVGPAQLRPPGAHPFTFWLGTHHAADLATSPVPMFLSRRALVLDPAPEGSTPATWHRYDRQRKTLPRALQPWRIDSAGFTELHLFGEHHVSPQQYAEEVCRYQEEIGLLDGAFVQDWMVEPEVLAITRGSIELHQRKSIASLLLLRTIAPRVPWVPVLQGWSRGDHERHLAMYYANGIDLRCEPVVGVGSVCRRQGMVEADTIVRDLSGCDLHLHVLGYKFTGTPQVLHYVDSADSLAWSFDAREAHVRLPGHDHSSPLGSEQWTREGSPDAWVKRKKGAGWEVLAKGDAGVPVADKEAGRALLRARGYTFSRESWTCQNCLEAGLLWRRTMLAKVFLSADLNTQARTYGHREPTAAEFEEFAAYDEAEGHDLGDVTLGDFERSRQHLSAVSGVDIPEVPRCHFLRDPAGACTPAVYEPPGTPRRVYRPLALPPVRGLPDARTSRGERGAFVPWTPPLRLGATPPPAAHRPKAPAGPDLAAARRVGERMAELLVEEASDPPCYEGRNADEFYAIATNQADDVLTAAPAHREVMNAVRAWGARPEGTALRTAYRDGVLDALWAAARRAHPRERTVKARAGGADWEPT
jgi:hypothetical protein